MRSAGDGLENITIQKTTLMAFAGLTLIGLLGAYVILSSPASYAAPPENDAQGNPGGGEAGSAPSGTQDIYIKALSNGAYDKQEVKVQKGLPVRLHFSAEPNAGCGRQLVIYGLNVQAISRSGEESVVDFTPQKEGIFEYNCGMRMWRAGKLIVQ